MFLGLVDTLLDFRDQRFEKGAFFHHQFTAQKIRGLNAVGAFIDGADFTIPEDLFHGIRFGVAISAEKLHALHAHIEAPFAAIGFDNRGENFSEARIVRFLFFGGGADHFIEAKGRIKRQAAHAFNQSLHFKQHPAHIRVPDDGHLGRGGIGAVFDGPSLEALGHIIQGMLISTRSMRKSLVPTSRRTAFIM